tara:strand:- start:932 stop:1363 length:432 start_codon:yes stop_codon:yes gene_type:complete
MIEMNINTFDLKPNDSTDFDVRNWKTKLEKTKRKGRVKISFKLGKEESEGFTAFMNTVKPEKLAEEDFIRVLFFKGVEALNNEFSEIAKAYATQKAGELALEGINPGETVEAADSVLGEQDATTDSSESDSKEVDPPKEDAKA